MVSVLKDEKSLNSPKDAPSSSDKENKRVSTNIRTIPEVGHPIIASVRKTKDFLQQQDDHNSVEH